MKTLVVEDEIVVARDLARILRRIGYEVQGIVKSVGEAFQVIDRRAPDVVLIDIVLRGDEDGITLARALQEEHNIPFLFITAHADRATVARAKATQPSGYLVKPFSKEEVYAALEIALVNYADEQALAQGDNSDGPGGLPVFRLHKIKSYIDAHLDEDLTLAELAEEAGMSKYYFSRLFKESTELPPYRYVLQRRVEKAKQLLEETERPIAQIAAQTGFSNQSHLGRLFQKHVGTSPAAYRKKQ